MYLLDNNDNEVLKFYVDLGRLSYLGKDLRYVNIYHYPIIIFEFMTGYFTTEELFEKNREIGLEFARDFEIMDIPKDISKSIKSSLALNYSKSSTADPRENKILSASTMLPTAKEKEKEKEQLNENIKKNINPDTKSYNINSDEFKNKLDSVYQNQMDNKTILNSINTFPNNSQINETPVKKIEKTDNLSKSLAPDLKRKKLGMSEKKTSNDKSNKNQCIPYFEYVQNYQMLIFYINSKESVKQTNPNFGKELEIFKENLEKYKRKLRILEIEKEIEFLNKKNEAIKDLNKDLEEAIKHKKDNLQKVTNQLKPNQINYNNKLNQLKNNLNGKGQYQLIYDSFVYQKMAEVCFVFFNNKIQSLYTIPKFYNEPISYHETKKMERLEFYTSDKKNISAMMGHICQLLIYLSKTFNIPLRFPIFLNGSRSYILRSVKDKMFLPLYFDAKKDDKHGGSFESALNCLKDDIKEIFNFLSMFPEIISKNDNENINNMNGKYLFFFFFVVFNHSLFRFMKTLQNAV